MLCDVQGITMTNLIGFDPMLDSLALNGYQTAHHRPQTGSPVLGAGNPQGCTDATGGGLFDDQRGELRPTGGRCDIGAVELVCNTPATLPTMNLTASGDDVTLSWSVETNNYWYEIWQPTMQPYAPLGSGQLITLTTSTTPYVATGALSSQSGAYFAFSAKSNCGAGETFAPFGLFRFAMTPGS